MKELTPEQYNKLVQEHAILKDQFHMLWKEIARKKVFTIAEKIYLANALGIIPVGETPNIRSSCPACTSRPPASRRPPRVAPRGGGDLRLRHAALGDGAALDRTPFALVVLADAQDIIALGTALHRAFGKQRRLGRTRDQASVGEAAGTQ